MKALLLATLFISTGVCAQSLEINGLKNLLTQRKNVLEKLNPGMSKKTVTITKYPTELGPCEVTETAIQTVLKIEGDKIIVYSKETFSPASSAACAGFESQTLGVIFFEEKPSLEKDLSDLDESAAGIKSITKAGEIVTLSYADITAKYDLSKPSFKNTVFLQNKTSTMNGSDISDIDVYSIDLKKVLFCASADADECAEGDWSDILY